MPSPPSIHTYHCLCTHLLLATPRPLPTYPRRVDPSADHAFILPLSRPASDTSPSKPSLSATSLALPDATPQIIRRPDGFERRHWLRCPRCHLPVGYFLDTAQLIAAGRTDAGAAGDTGPWERVMYVLPRAMVKTEEMVEGKGAEAAVG